MSKTIIFHAWDAKQAKKDGKRLTWTDRIIMLRSMLTHLEVELVERGYSFSSTTAGGSDGCRWEKIDYSHKKRWVVSWMRYG
jgi:hypothetical protein